MSLPLLITIDARTGLRESRRADIRTAILLTYVTLGWMTIEGAASLALGWVSKSLLLEAFGIDSVVELLSAGVLAATRLFGWWWLDSVAALGLIPFLIKEGRGAIRGEGCCHDCCRQAETGKVTKSDR